MTSLDIGLNDIVVAAVSAISLILCITFFNGASAETMPAGKYKAIEKNLISVYKAAKIRFDPLLGNTQRNIENTNTENTSETKQEKTVKSENPGFQNNPFITIEFDNTYHVKA